MTEELDDYIEKYLFWLHSQTNYVQDFNGVNPAEQKAENIKQGAVLKFRIKSSEFDKKVFEYEKRKVKETAKKDVSDLWESEVSEE